MKLKKLPTTTRTNFCAMNDRQRCAYPGAYDIAPGVPPLISEVGPCGRAVLSGPDPSERDSGLHYQVDFNPEDGDTITFIYPRGGRPSFWPETPYQAKNSGWEGIQGDENTLLPEDLE